MTIPLTLTTLTQADHLAPQTFDRACERLQAAHAHHTQAVNAVAEAKCSLEFKRAELLAKGIDGKNSEAREASRSTAQAFRRARRTHRPRGQSSTKPRKDLEHARLTWDCLRYKLRLLEVQKVLAGAA